MATRVDGNTTGLLAAARRVHQNVRASISPVSGGDMQLLSK